MIKAKRILKYLKILILRPIKIYIRNLTKFKENNLVVVNKYGSQILLDVSKYTQWIIRYTDYEKIIFDYLKNEILPDDVIVDAGANVGLYTTFFCKHATSGVVHAFEPLPELSSRIEQQCRLNGYDNVKVWTVALSDKPGLKTLNVNPFNDGGSSIVHQEIGAGSLQVEVVSLDGLFPTKPPTIIKLDIEGSEYLTLMGAEKILRTGRVRILIIETETEEKLLKLHRMLSPYGYGIVDISSAPCRWISDLTHHDLKLLGNQPNTIFRLRPS